MSLKIKNTFRKIKRILGAISFLRYVQIELLEFKAHPRIYLDVSFDILKMWILLMPLRWRTDPAPNGQVGLLLTMNDWPYQIKNDAIFGRALKNVGVKPVGVLSSRIGHRRARRYFKCFGIKHFVYLDEFPACENTQASIELAVNEFLRKSTTFNEVSSWVYRNSHIGPQILSTVARQLFETTPDPSEPIVQSIIREILPGALLTVHQMEWVVETLQPELAIASEVNYAYYGAAADVLVSSHIQVIQYVQSWREDSYFFIKRDSNTRREHPGAVTKEMMKELIERKWTDGHGESLDQMFFDRYGGRWFLQKQNQPDVQSYSRRQIIEFFGFDTSRPLGVVFAPVLWDANLFYGEDIFEDHGEWFVEAIRECSKNINVQWIVKLHPANSWKRQRGGVENKVLSELQLIETAFGSLPDHVKLLDPETEISSHSLFQSVDFALTVRGTSGMEAPCFGVLTVTGGTGRYAGLGFTVDPETPDEFRKIVASIHLHDKMTTDQKLLAQKHAYGAFVLRPWKIESFKPAIRHRRYIGDPLDYDIRPQLIKYDKIDDLLEWSDWALNSSIPIYINWSRMDEDASP